MFPLLFDADDAGAAKLDLKVDANGNCTTGDKVSLPLLFLFFSWISLNIVVALQNKTESKHFNIFPRQINQDYLEDAQVMSLKVTSSEQQCLLEKGEACSHQSQISCNTETLTRTDDCSSYESISPPQSTIALHNPRSALSEPMTLLSNAEPAPPQTSIPTQPSSQPTSPQIISPVTSSPHVNVNITFHIGHNSAGTPSVTPTDLGQADYHIPIAEEEESFSIPQQEAGKQSIMAVQESASYST